MRPERKLSRMISGPTPAGSPMLTATSVCSILLYTSILREIDQQPAVNPGFHYQEKKELIFDKNRAIMEKIWIEIP
jgi:hypothetical protein